MSILYFPLPLSPQPSHSSIYHHHCPSTCSWWPHQGRSKSSSGLFIRQLHHSRPAPCLSVAETSVLPEHLSIAPSPSGQEHLSHCKIEFHHAALGYVTRNIWPDVRGGLGLLRYLPGTPCPHSTKGIWSSNRKEWEFSAVSIPCETVHATYAWCKVSLIHFLSPLFLSRY